jgi:hypothetical protein
MKKKDTQDTGRHSVRSALAPRPPMLRGVGERVGGGGWVGVLVFFVFVFVPHCAARSFVEGAGVEA